MKDEKHSDREFEWQEYITSGIVDGQYTESVAIKCTHCECTN